ncbi:MAG TPA: CsbD family protein [Candidatus Binatia bacterium]|nr:CsbD family protein [Candidatus Binatia bacterium]
MENMDRERTPLNRDILAGQWKQLRGTVKSWWGRLTDDDFDRIAGQKDRLIGTLQEKYGYTRDMAQQEVDRRLQEYGEHHMNPGQSYSGVENVGQTVMDTAQNMAQSASQTVNDMKTKAQQWGSAMGERAGNATSSVGQSMSSLANTIRQKAPAEGMMGSAASTMATQLEAAGSYLQDNGFENMTRDLTGLIRRYPLQSLLIGFTIGYLWARNSER